MRIISKSKSPDQSKSSAAAHVSRLKKNKDTEAAGRTIHGKFPVQRQPEEELAQGKFPVQRQEEEEPVQGKFPIQRQEEEEPVQGKFPVQRQEEEEPVQGKFAIQRQEEEEPAQGNFPVQTAADQPSSSPGISGAGVPKSVRVSMEDALGTNFSDVKVHADSSKASEVGALAYTQGTDIHFAPGQYSPGTSKGNQLLGHELAHVAQQKEGRVEPTGSVGGLPLNDSPSLENEADSAASKVK
jgi:hypothetical protein